MTKDVMFFVIVAAFLAIFISENQLSANLVKQCTAASPLMVDMPEVKKK